MKLTKADEHWRWLAGRIWHGTLTGWTPLSDRVTKADRAIVERKIKAGEVEVDEGMYRLTDAGRAALKGSEP